MALHTVQRVYHLTFANQDELTDWNYALNMVLSKQIKIKRFKKAVKD